MTISDIEGLISKAFEKTVQNSGGTIVEALYHTTVNHVRNRYPGSTHWSTDKISKGVETSTSTTASGDIDVNVAGASRAYHDVVIRPIRAKMLTIPIHGASYGKRVKDFDGLFKIKGKNVLFQRTNSGIVGLFALAKQAFQKQDESLLPKDDTFAENIMQRFIKQLDHNLDGEFEKTS